MTIAVIGHGRSPEGKKWGKRIDACSTVVRMWDWTWQSLDDYGQVYDYGLFVLTPKGLNIFERFNTCHPYKGWLAYFGKAVNGVWPQPITVLENERWAKRAHEELGGVGLTGKLTLTRGTAAACWAIEEAEPKEKVILVGFDNVWLRTNQSVAKSFNPVYWNQYMSRFVPNVEKVYPTNQPKTATHDMVVERTLLELMASERKVKLQFAHEVW